MPDGLTIFSIVIAEAAGASVEQCERGQRGGRRKPRHDFFSACGLVSLIR